MAKITTSCSGSERPHLWCLLTNNVECVEYILIVIVAHKCQPSSRDQAHQYTDTTLHFGMYSVVSQHEKSNEEWLWSHHTTLLFSCHVAPLRVSSTGQRFGTIFGAIWHLLFNSVVWHHAAFCNAVRWCGCVSVYWCAWGLIYKMSYDLS